MPSPLAARRSAQSGDPEAGAQPSKEKAGPTPPTPTLSAVVTITQLGYQVHFGSVQR